MRRKLIVGVLLSVFCLMGGLAESAGKAAEGGPFQKAAPFKLQTPKGETVSLEEFAGKVVYLDFWGSWCPPCVEEVPHLIALYDQYKEKGFVVIGIALGDSKKSLLHFIEKKKVPYPVVLGEDSLLEAYRGVVFLPTAFVIDRKGFIRRKLFGYREKEEIEQIIRPLLEEK